MTAIAYAICTFCSSDGSIRRKFMFSSFDSHFSVTFICDIDPAFRLAVGVEVPKVWSGRLKAIRPHEATVLVFRSLSTTRVKKNQIDG